MTELQRHRLRQAQALARLDVGRVLFTRRAFGFYFLALLALVPGLGQLFPWVPPIPVGRIPVEHAESFQYFLRFFVFFGCAAIFGDLFRREMKERSLHYWFLAPVRRDVLLAGRFLGSLLFAVALFGLAGVLSLVCFYLPQGGGLALHELFSPRVIGLVVAYGALTAFAVVAYGALFLLFGLLVKNPIVPGLAFWLWELVEGFLPGFLKPLTVVHYLKGMAPVPVTGTWIGTAGDAPSLWLAIPGLVVFVGVCLALSAWKLRRMEIAYGAE